MDARQYILKELETLITQFPNIRVRYEYDKYAVVHFVEVVPNEVYHLDDNYIAWENEMTDKFIELFPVENICFISDDALVGIENAEITLCGLGYMPFSTKQEVMIFEQNEIFIQQNIIPVLDKITSSDVLNHQANERFAVTENYSTICQTYSLAA